MKIGLRRPSNITKTRMTFSQINYLRNFNIVILIKTPYCVGEFNNYLCNKGLIFRSYVEDHLSSESTTRTTASFPTQKWAEEINKFIINKCISK